jgi:hypothetical protein
VGDEVVVNDEIRDWVKKRNWSEDMLDCIGKSFIIRNITPTYDTCQVTFVNKGFWWPIQCLDPVGGKNVKWYYKEK